MSMRSIPVDVSRLTGFMCASAPEVRVDPTTGEMRLDRDSGAPLYLVGVVVKLVGTRLAYVLDVQVAGEPVGIKEGQAVKLYDLEARPWEVDGRSGMSYRASAITTDTGGSSSTDVPSSSKNSGSGRGAAA
jgi:hypothetical protein